MSSVPVAALSRLCPISDLIIFIPTTHPSPNQLSTDVKVDSFNLL